MRKNLLKKMFALTLSSVMAISVLYGCGKEAEEPSTTINKADLTPQEYYGVDSWDAVEYEVAKEDHYRNYYEVFVYSFADSDGDGIGDIQGLISKLDYIEEMGFNGIWLMPIMPSGTYHKYDVDDYYDIDSKYGTLEDYTDLIDACHSRNINVIIDLVFNHTSSSHEWFTTACNYYKSLGAGEEPDFEECPYANYYNFAKTEDVKGKSTYSKISGSEYSYEGMFWSGMPDLNLDNPLVRAEIEDVVDFWINLGTDGFRLDAVKEYFSGHKTKNLEVLDWFETYIRSVKEDAFVVGEVWEPYSSIKSYYNSGFESFFDYGYGNNSGYIITNINTRNGLALSEKLEKTEKGYFESNPNMVNSPFLSNHDTGRIAGFCNYDENRIKLAGAINQIMSGCSFVYYGEELGMTGSGKDENKRAPMAWTSYKSGYGITVGPTAMDSDIVNQFGALDTQEKDIDSIYWYYRKMLHIRRTYEEIAKGSTTSIDAGDKKICAISKEYNGETMYILCNFGEEEKTITLSKDTYAYEKLIEYLVTNTDNEVKLNGDSITIPAYGIAFLK